ncbi:MAG: Fic family protein [Thaumarchaeota archaeon]|nr:Fic family protein [Nitrososphaerota archaeon]
MRPEDATEPATLATLDASRPLWGGAEDDLNAAVAEIERFGVGGASGGAATRPLAHAVAEAVASSLIEGVRSSRAAVFAQLVTGGPGPGGTDDDYAANNARALLSMLEGTDPGSEIGLDSIARAHRLLYEGVAYGPGDRTGHAPGEWRRKQNWIVGGPDRAVIYTPPAPGNVVPLLENLIEYINSAEASDHALVRCAVAHAQFEAIHPFPDGNGRVGRMLISMMMRKYGLLSSQALALSASLYTRRAQYYALLRGVTADGAWAQWISYFVDACAEAAEDGSASMRDLVSLRKSYFTNLGDRAAEGTLQVLDSLFENPYITVPMTKRITGMGNRAASMIIEDAVGAGILERMPGRAKTILYVSQGILDAMGGGAQGGQ